MKEGRGEIEGRGREGRERREEGGRERGKGIACTTSAGATCAYSGPSCSHSGYDL